MEYEISPKDFTVAVADIKLAILQARASKEIVTVQKVFLNHEWARINTNIFQAIDAAQRQLPEK